MSAGGGAGAGRSGAAASGPPPAPAGSGGAAYHYDVFISYAHEDGKDVAALLHEGLTRRGLRVWRDETRLSAGDMIHDEIKKGLASSSHVVALITPEYLKRAPPLIELGMASYGNHAGRIIPVLHGTRHQDVERQLFVLAGRYMLTWDGGSEQFIDEIARIVRESQEAGSNPAPEARGGMSDRDAIRTASRGAATSIPQAINDIKIDRSGQVAAIEGLLKSKKRVAVVGDKGSGKSVLSCLLYEGLAARGAALLVRCDDFLGAESAEYLDKEIVPGHRLSSLAATAAAAGGMTIIFDSLDAAGRDERTMRAFRRLLEMVWGAGARTVVTVRRYDYEYYGAIATTNWGEKYELGPLSDDELEDTLRKLGGLPVPPGLRALLHNPLNLHLFSRVLEKSPDADLASIGGEIDLYDAHWHHHVELEEMCEQVRDELYNIAEEMFGARKTMVPHSPGDPKAAACARSSGILVRTEDGGSVRYFHHAYLDYAMSRALLERHQPVEEYLRADEYNVFLRPTLSFALAMAHKRDPGGFATAVEEILRAGIKYHWKIVAVESLASVEPESGAAYARLEALLTDQPLLQRHFLRGLAERRNASWLLAWGDTVLAWASDPRNSNGAFIVEYLKAAAAADGRCHGTAFAAAVALAENSGDGQVRRKAVTALAGIEADGKTEWLAAMSSNGDPRVRAGVSDNLPSLLERDPGAVPEIFCNIYAYEEMSAEKTHMAGRETLRLASTRSQDNDMNRWELDRMFPRLMDKNPPAMMRAVILVAEYRNRDVMSARPGLVDDSLQWWLDAKFSGDGDSPLARAEKYMNACGDEDFSRLVPVLEGTRLASFRGMLIGSTARRGRAFLDKLVDLLSDPRVHGVCALRPAVDRAIGGAWGMLDEGQKGRILGAMGEAGAARGETGRSPEAGGGATPPAASPGLQDPAPSPGRMQSEGRPSGPGAEGDAPELDHGFQHMPPERAEVAGPAASIEGMLDANLDWGGKITLLESIMAALDGRPGDLSEYLVSRITTFLIGARRDADPEEGGDATAAEPGHTLVATHSVRGLVAGCLIRIAALHKDGAAPEAVLGAIRELSEDPSGSVRSDVARSLALLLPGHYDLARSMASSYSRDPDTRVQCFLPEVICHIMQKEPATASAMVGNVLETSARPPNCLILLLLHLAMALKEPRAEELLRRIADEGAFSKELRMDMPFILKERLLASKDHRHAALGLLLALLDDPEREVRHKAAFFTLNGFDDNPAIDNREYVREIAPHLGRMSSLLEEKPLDFDIAEPLTRFLEEFWREVPEAALDFLEKIARIHGVKAASESSIVEGSLNVLAGLLQYHSLYDGEWNRCVDVLDTYAAVGWPAALDLLAKMGERD